MKFLVFFRNPEKTDLSTGGAGPGQTEENGIEAIFRESNFFCAAGMMRDQSSATEAFRGHTETTKEEEDITIGATTVDDSCGSFNSVRAFEEGGAPGGRLASRRQTEEDGLPVAVPLHEVHWKRFDGIRCHRLNVSFKIVSLE